MSLPKPRSKRRRVGTAVAPTPSLEVAENNEAATGPDRDLMRCPICTQFPRKDVYVCIMGHSVCADCRLKLKKKCPTCQGLFLMTRNFLAERLLDSMKFQCSFKEHGCMVAPMKRQNWTSHEAQCDFNPNSVSFCSILDGSCKYKLCPVSIEDPEEMNAFLNHMITRHHSTVQDVNLGVPYKSEWTTEANRDDPLFSEPIYRLMTNEGRYELFVLYMHISEINEQPAIFMKCVRLTDENKDKIFVSFSITVPTIDGTKLTNLTWTVQPQELRQLNYGSIQERDFSSFRSIPKYHFQNYMVKNPIRIDCLWHQ